MDVGDLGILAANYGQGGRSWAQGDFNGDGVVDVADLGILAANYGRGTGGTVEADNANGQYFGENGGKQVSPDDPTKPGEGCAGIGLVLIGAVFANGLMRSFGDKWVAK